MHRAMAIIERELRRFRRSPFLIVLSLIFPLVQLIVLGYAFGGNVKNLTVAIVDQDGGLPAVKVRELAGAVAANARTFDTVAYASEGQALEALRDGRVNGVLTIPPDYSRRVVGEREPRLALIEDNTDNFVAATLAGSMNGMVAGLNEKRPSADRVASGTMLDVVELYPYVPYVQYLLPGSITMSIFMMVMIGGGIIFIDDKARGLHEGYLVTPITRLELIAGFNISGTVKAVLAGAVLMTIGSLIADNTDNFVASALTGTITGLVSAYNEPAVHASRTGSAVALDVVEVYPYVPYIQYLLPGSITMSIFMMVMIGGGIIFIDDKARGLHEGYLVTPITRLELIAGFNLSGTIKAVLAGIVLMTIGSVIAGVPDAFDPIRLLRLFVVIVVTSLALISMMFLIMVRVKDPLLPRAIFGVLNTLLYFPSGAVYPPQAFPQWMSYIAAADPFTYAVHAFKSLLLKNTGFGAITYDLGFLMIFSVVAMTAATLLFKRTL